MPTARGDWVGPRAIQAPVGQAALLVAHPGAELGRLVGNFDFPVVGGAATAPTGRPAWRLHLDGPARARKLVAAEAYRELREEVGRVRRAEGLAGVAEEVLWPVGGRGAY